MSGALFGWSALSIWIALSVVMTAGWAVTLKARNGGWVDVFWSLGLGAVGVTACVIDGIVVGTDVPALRTGLAAALVGIWSLRLGSHIAHRARQGGDDPRYAQLRQEWGARYRARLFLFLQIQALAGVPLLLSVLLGACRPGTFGDGRDIVAILIFAISIAGEASADRALRRFATFPHRRQAVCDIGLWRWSRHPNYFFECVAWLVWPVLAAGVAGYGWGWCSLAAPLLMYWLLVYVSGIPPLEAHMARSRGEAWHRYAAKTSAFFPWPPRR